MVASFLFWIRTSINKLIKAIVKKNYKSTGKFKELFLEYL